MATVATDPQAMIIAARENASTQKGLGELQLILQKLLMNNNIQKSTNLGNKVQEAIVSHLSSKYKGTKDLGIKHAPLYVLIGAEMPAILVETGFISNPLERKHLLWTSYQKDLAKGICSGIVSYLSGTTDGSHRSLR
ncbi:MAG: N-acetylmuramoyl-L-alanine amidase [Deltaproteobacteria bacterium]|nr:N-acetylmuramoyl-L-alanine amidase [Deltaproteobacteria bacterium]MBW1977169.1 N-acetylmuramoyl-L-alanine amidase [Deltaproteobacteria bacterium]MBW2045595.1 N-acetylmuramoyl-L-alanine amidase [Deltaproteobacteria bacterium]MBW2300263.1 N-acetylmuramoyl-L-alanine amidase [Deltaproteobacteria bacterium]